MRIGEGGGSLRVVRGIWTVSQHRFVVGRIFIGRVFADMDYGTGIAQTTLEESDEEDEE